MGTSRETLGLQASCGPSERDRALPWSHLPPSSSLTQIHKLQQGAAEMRRKWVWRRTAQVSKANGTQQGDKQGKEIGEEADTCFQLTRFNQDYL